MTKNYKPVYSDDSLPSRELFDTLQEAKSLKTDLSSQNYILSSRSPPEPAQEQDPVNEESTKDIIIRFQGYIEARMKAFAEELKSKHERPLGQESRSAVRFEVVSIGRSTAVDGNSYDVTLLPKRLKPSVILAPESAADPDSDDEYDDEEWKRYEKEINDSASTLNQNISEKIDEERKAYLAAAGKRYRKAKAESPEKAKEEREQGVAIFKKLMEFVNTVLDRLVELFRSFLQRFTDNIKTAMSWVREQLARISHAQRMRLKP